MKLAVLSDTTLPIVRNLTFKNLPAITACHGSPRRTKEKMLPNNETTFSLMEQNRNSLILCGHTHFQEIIEHSEKTVLNPGSVGVPLNSNGKTQFLILHGSNGTWHHEFLSLNYDVEQVISDLYKEELHIKAPSWCKITEHILRTGDGSHGNVLIRAMALCKEEYGVCNWPNIPEMYWEQALKELIG